MKKIKVGCVGYGYWGKNIMRNLATMKNVDLGIVCDSNPTNLIKAKEVLGDKLFYTSNYSELITNPEIEAIVISTPPQTHYELAYQAIKAGKHVFVEKPMTTNYNDAIDVAGRAIENNLILMVGHTFVYNPVINDLKYLIESGELGEIYYIDFNMTNLGKYQQYNVLWDLAPHGISIVLHLLNNPEVIRVEVNGISAIRNNLTDIAYLTLYFKNGSFANMHFSWLNPNKQRQLTVVGSKKMAVFDDINPLEKIRLYDKGISEKVNKEFSSWGESIIGYRHGNIIIPNTSTGEPLKKELEHFIDCIINNTRPITDGSNGTKVVKIIEEAVNKLK